MSTLLPQYRPEDYGAGSGLIWLGTTYTYEQVTARWPHVRWSYLYSGITDVGDLSELSMIIVESGGTTMEDYWNTYSGMYRSGCSWVTNVSGQRTSVIETVHTYSGLPQNAWQSWTQDEAAIMEAYELTISGGSGGYAITASNPSGIAIQGLGTPPLFTIAPGNYNVSYGHIWFYNTCNIDARSARFFANRYSASHHVGYSPTWRCPTGDEAKAVITLGSDAFVQCPWLGGYDSSHDFHDYGRGQYFEKCDIYLPEVIANSPVGTHYGVYAGAGIRFLAMYNVKIRNITTRGAFRYSVIFSPDSDGSSYNEYFFGSNYKFLVGVKFRIRNGKESGGWMNNSIFYGGMWQQADPGTGWDHRLNPTVMFDNDNSAANPNRDTREDQYLALPAQGSYIQFKSAPSFWTENFGTETLNIVHFIRASGWSGVTMRRGRFEGQNDLMVNPDTLEIIHRKWWITGDVSSNVFEDNVSHSVLDGCPREYIGNGIDFNQINMPLPGYSTQGTHTPFIAPYPESREQGPNHSTKIMSQDLLLTSPGSNIYMVSSGAEKMRAIYIDEIIDSETGRIYPVAKVKAVPYTWIKWKLASEPDSAFTSLVKTYPIGSTLRIRIGDFEGLPSTAATGNYLPYIRFYSHYYNDTALVDGDWTAVADVTYFPTGIVDGLGGKAQSDPSSSNAWSYFAANANVFNGSYAELQYTYNYSGVVRMESWINYYDYNGAPLKRDAGVDYGYAITIS